MKRVLLLTIFLLSSLYRFSMAQATSELEEDSKIFSFGLTFGSSAHQVKGKATFEGLNQDTEEFDSQDYLVKYTTGGLTLGTEFLFKIGNRSTVGFGLEGFMDLDRTPCSGWCFDFNPFEFHYVSALIYKYSITEKLKVSSRIGISSFNSGRVLPNPCTEGYKFGIYPKVEAKTPSLSSTIGLDISIGEHWSFNPSVSHDYYSKKNLKEYGTISDFDSSVGGTGYTFYETEYNGHMNIHSFRLNLTFARYF